MGHALDGVRQKFHRAREHIFELEREVNKFGEGSPYITESLLDEVGENRSGKQVYPERIVVNYVREPPLRISAIAGDAVHNMRSALDLLAWQLVKANGQEPDRRNAFPVLTEAKRWEGALKRELRGVAPTVTKVIRSLQPFENDKPEQDGIFVLHQLDIIDKHRLLPVYQCAGNFTDVTFENAIIFGHPDLASDFINPLVKGTQLVRLYHLIPYRTANIDIRLKVDVAFDVNGPAHGNLVVNYLKELLDNAEMKARRFDMFFV